MVLCVWMRVRQEFFIGGATGLGMSPSPRKSWWKRLNPFSAFQRRRAEKARVFSSAPTAVTPIAGASPSSRRKLSRAQKAAIIAALGAAAAGGVGFGVHHYKKYRERQRVERNAAESRATRARLEERLRESPERVRVNELDAGLLNELLGKRHAEEWQRAYKGLVQSEWVDPSKFHMHAFSLRALVDGAISTGVSVADLGWYLPSATNLARLRTPDGRTVGNKEEFFRDPLVKENLRSLGNNETARQHRAAAQLFEWLHRKYGGEMVRDILESMGVEFE